MGIIRSVRWLVVGMLLALMLTVSVPSFAGVFVSVGFGPPAIPVYVQPPCPEVGYMWTPGYWGYSPNGYFWVPGTWVVAPQPGLLWTPGYWGWGGSAFIFHGGYWGPTIGFYGGINYGYGYGGVGYQGGYWRGRDFYYNRSVNNVERIHVTNVYNTRVVENGNRVAFNGGRGGIEARATASEERAAREKHFAPTSMQTRHQEAAASNRQLWASENHGRPAIAATSRPGEFKGRGVVAAKEAGAPYKAPERGAEPRTNNAVRRPGNKAARPATAEHNNVAPAHNSVPRPPQTANRETPARTNNTAPRPTAERSAAPTRNVAPRPTAPRVENTSRPTAAPRPLSTPHGNTAGRGMAAPRSNAPAPHANAPAPHAAAPHAAAPVHESHPEPRH
jgi:WXXGXW repeat (2 copies)